MARGGLLTLGAQAAHWSITPAAHPAATLAQIVGVWAQLVAGLGGGGWMLWRAWRAAYTVAPAPAGPVSAR